MVPDAQTLRTTLGKLSIEQFYHTVMAEAREALADQVYEEACGSPPLPVSDGYDFMRCLAVHLRSQALHRPEPGRMFFPQQTTGRRKPMEPTSPSLPD